MTGSKVRTFKIQDCMKMKLTLVMVISGLLAVTATQAQEERGPSLAARAQEEGVGWIINEWQAWDENGNPLELSYSWDLDNRVAMSHLKSSWIEAKGISALVPFSDEVQYVGFDNRGGRSEGAWSLENGKLVLTVKWTNSQGETGKVAYVHSHPEPDRMTVKVHQLDDWGYREEPAVATFEFKAK